MSFFYLFLYFHQIHLFFGTSCLPVFLFPVGFCCLKNPFCWSIRSCEWCAMSISYTFLLKYIMTIKNFGLDQLNFFLRFYPGSLNLNTACIYWDKIYYTPLNCCFSHQHWTSKNMENFQEYKNYNIPFKKFSFFSCLTWKWFCSK